MRYDAATGLLWCPEPECGYVARRETRAHGSGDRQMRLPGLASDGQSGSAGVENGEWTPEPPNLRRRLFVGLIVFATAAAVLVMGLTPLLWPQRPFLSVAPGELVFEDQTGTGVLPQALAIRNQGKGRLDWQVLTDVPWLTVEPLSGSIESDLQIITVKADTLALPQGTHTATFSVMAVGAQNSPQVIAVQVQLAMPPEARAIKDLLGDDVEVHYGVQPPYVAGPIGVPIHLVQAEATADVTWHELMDFLRQDPTDRSPYIQDLYMCGAFAEALYNNAATAGIRTAWVSLDIRGRTIGHALNAFFTSDRGLVFVDCTGGDAVMAVSPGFGGAQCEHDRIAYVRPGLEYGLISLDRAESPSYEFYREYSESWESYVSDLEEYNRLAVQYNFFVTGRTLIPGSADARKAQELHSELLSRRVSLDMQREIVGECRWVSLGIVDRVRIYW